VLALIISAGLYDLVLPLLGYLVVRGTMGHARGTMGGTMGPREGGTPPEPPSLWEIEMAAREQPFALAAQA
jgi:hypothetical protein